jgi:hypothetical protein
MTAALIALAALALFVACARESARRIREAAYWDGRWGALTDVMRDEAEAAQVRAADVATGTPVWAQVARQMGVRP